MFSYCGPKQYGTELLQFWHRYWLFFKFPYLPLHCMTWDFGMNTCYSVNHMTSNLGLGNTLLTHWGRVTHICVGKLNIIGSDNGLLPGRCQAIIWTNAGILLIRPLRTSFSEMFVEIHTFSFKKIDLKMSSGKWRPFCLGLNVLIRPQHSFSRRNSRATWKWNP